MKHFISFWVMLLISSAVFAQGKKIDTITFEVDGNCSMCKERIEDAAYMRGVKSAQWDQATHLLTLIFKPSRTSPEQVARRIADVGHDTELLKSTDEVYEKLPECCQYKTNECEH